MAVALKIVDQTLGVYPHVTRELRLASERITLRELLRRRIEEEVREINAGRGDVPSLVTPAAQETALNGARRRRLVDADKQFDAAVRAFQRSRIVIIVDGRQVQDLDHAFGVTPQTEVRFVKLVPLVGG
jgi:hypothetical protein